MSTVRMTNYDARSHDIKHAPPEVRKRVYVASPFLFTKITETGNHVPEEEPARTHHIHKEARRQLTSSKARTISTAGSMRGLCACCCA